MKAPFLAANFSENGKAAKYRIDNILSRTSRKSGLAAFAVVAAVTFTMSAFVGCSTNESIGVIGGSDGPTKVFVSNKKGVEDAKNYIDKLYEARTAFVGDASAVGNLINLVFVDGKIRDYELQTKQEPYGVTINFDQDAYPNNLKEPFNALLISLVDNCGYVTLNYADQQSTFTRKDAEDKYHVSLSEVTSDRESFAEFYRDVMLLSSNIDRTQFTVDELVSMAILETQSDSYSKGECSAEGHIVLGTANVMESDEMYQKGARTYVYALTTYGEYAFNDGNFVKDSGSGVIPVRLAYDEYKMLVEYRVPEDGSNYAESVKQMYPEEYLDRALTNNPDDYKTCLSQEIETAKSYLEKLGRVRAKVGDAGDFGRSLLTDNGVSVEVSNKMAEYKELGYYPYWIGNLERVEDGTRYVYKMDYDKAKNLISFTKSKYDGGEVVESYVYDSLTGESVDL